MTDEKLLGCIHPCAGACAQEHLLSAGECKVGTADLQKGECEEGRASMPLGAVYVKAAGREGSNEFDQVFLRRR